MGANVQGLELKETETILKNDEEYIKEVWVDGNGNIRMITETPVIMPDETTQVTQLDKIEANLDYIVMLNE